MLTDLQVANIFFNETRSLSGHEISTARVNIAHAIINGDNAKKRPATGPTTAKVPDVEKEAYADCTQAVVTAKADAVDPTDGGIHFNFRKNNWKGDFQGHAIKSQIGPLSNSYPTDDLPAEGIYANTYA